MDEYIHNQLKNPKIQNKTVSTTTNSLIKTEQRTKFIDLENN